MKFALKTSLQNALCSVYSGANQDERYEKNAAYNISVPVCFRIKPVKLDQAVAVANDRGVPYTSIFREAVDQYLERYELEKQVGSQDSTAH
ncbi:MAG: hypothetical protein HC769_21715 [Cyanobacteria bacterium CRU_2_1]|nr:hypothetical protein [Cyanobacteria bacterium CRU_2_1]